MSSQRAVEERFDTLTNCQRLYNKGKYFQTDLQQEENKVRVTANEGGFNIITGTDKDGLNVLDAFNKYFPEEGEFSYADGDHDFTQAKNRNQLSDHPEIKFEGRTYGVIWQNEPRPLFSDMEYEVIVYSNEENFQYDNDSAEVIGDVFPEITEMNQNDDIIDEAITMAIIDMNRWH